MAFYGYWRTNDLKYFKDFKLGDKRMDRDDVDQYLDFDSKKPQNLTAEVSAVEAGIQQPNIRVESNLGYADYKWTAKSYSKSGEEFYVKVLS